MQKCKICNNTFKPKNIRHVFCSSKCKNNFAHQALSVEESLYKKAKKRAKQKNIEFSIKIEDIKIPKKCPILGAVLCKYRNRTMDNSYSLDRIDSNKGYVPGNIQVISYRANTLKSNGELEEFEKIVKWMKENED